MKILVTGGAGFIGSFVSEKYLQLGHEVIIIDNLVAGSEKNIPKGATFYHADITQFQKIREILLKEKPQILNHHAAQVSVSKSVEDPAYDFSVNVSAFEQLLLCSKQCGVQKIIFPSSAAVYGDAAVIPTPEHADKKPMTPYGKHKLQAEEKLKKSGIPYTIFRYANVYGPRQTVSGEAGVVAVFCDRLLKNQEVQIYGDGSQTRDFIYIEDVALANVLALTCGENETFNISTEQQISVFDLFILLKEISGSLREPLYKNPRKGDIQISCLANTKAKKLLGFNAQVSLKEGLCRTYEWLST